MCVLTNSLLFNSTATFFFLTLSIFDSKFNACCDVIIWLLFVFNKILSLSIWADDDCDDCSDKDGEKEDIEESWDCCDWDDCCADDTDTDADADWDDDKPAREENR